MTYPLTVAQAKLAELAAEARRSHRPVTISEHGRPVAALINVDDLADLQDRAALAAHLADKAAGAAGSTLRNQIARSTGSTRKASNEPARRLPGDGLTQPRPYPRRGQGSVHTDAPCYQHAGRSALSRLSTRARAELPGRSMISLRICSATFQVPRSHDHRLPAPLGTMIVGDHWVHPVINHHP